MTERNKDLWYEYMRGWSDGAGMQTFKECRDEFYEQGYIEGRKARKDASALAAARLGVKPLVLSPADTEEDADA